MSHTTTSHRIGVKRKTEYPDPQEQNLLRNIQDYLHLPIDDLKIIRVYNVEKTLQSQQVDSIAENPMIDPVTEIGMSNITLDPSFDWCVEVSYKPGLTDNAGNTAKETIQDFLSELFSDNESVHSSTLYLLKGSITLENVQRISKELLANPLIEEIHIQEITEHPAEEIPIHISDESLIQLSKNRQLALNLEEMQAIREHFSLDEVAHDRANVRLGWNPTDVEIEVLAQTWSEHCKHKIFNAKIEYNDNGKTETVDSLFKTYIKGATDEIEKKVDWLVSVFTDNAGIIQLNDTYNLAFKVETHNSPSALDPYGGALTGILGVNRDILGAGIGARLLANTDVFCFAQPDYNKQIPKRLLHPKRVFEGVRRGVEHGGNKSGIPTVNGSIVFDERYLGKPLVYCGTVGILPAKIDSRETHLKEIHPGDRIIIAGGRTGKDGIHGATFSSEELHAESPTSAVQIGDPFTQKKLHDFLIDARDEGLYRTLTDNGAGGFSSSVGEMAELSGGCEVHLDRALLKYHGMLPWEILLSESQERMTLAVPQEQLEALQKIADLHEVEIVDLGSFTDSGKLHVLQNGKSVAYLGLDFLHEGVPQLKLEAVWITPEEKPLTFPSHVELGKDLHGILSLYNVCSKETVIRQYDHEVQATSALKPLVGIENDGPSDSGIIRPLECLQNPETEKEAFAISNGICPKYSDIDAYHMAACAVDEAVRNLIAVGADPSHIAILDNFCWPDPIFDPIKTPDGKYKCAQLVRANQALYEVATAYGTPLISGKDSMKNDYKIDSTKISVPPTLLVSAIGKIPDVEKSVSMDVKAVGDSVYLIGMTRNELGASEYAAYHDRKGGIVPKVPIEEARKSYHALYQAIQSGIVASCHDCSDGGLAVALAEMAFAGGLGLNVDLSHVPSDGVEQDVELLFSESPSRLVLTVGPDHKEQLEKILAGCNFGCIGEVIEAPELRIKNVLTENIYDLKASWQKTLKRM